MYTNIYLLNLPCSICRTADSFSPELHISAPQAPYGRGARGTAGRPSKMISRRAMHRVSSRAIARRPSKCVPRRARPGGTASLRTSSCGRPGRARARANRASSLLWWGRGGRRPTSPL
uniref:Uncharacterized protein n=1 Tax=Spironucleus salmonicida TaxID=348837 RepID=V6LPZ7_9EUKA|eukprot:EST46318.1 Hypothetical protein SS50377_13705 [Spironucleus salmonicida]